MSYILEALRKSEQERNPERVPDLDTHHRHISGERKSHAPFWIGGVTLVVINLLFIFYWISRTPEVVEPLSKINTTPVPIVTKVEAQETELVTSTINTVTDSEQVNDPVTEQVAKPISKPKITSNVKATQTEPEFDSNVASANEFNNNFILPDISELPLNMQRQIPDLEFSTHIYIQGGGSFIIINGRSYSEGMFIEKILKVIKITSEGIVLESNGRQFTIASMTNWHQN